MTQSTDRELLELAAKAMHIAGDKNFMNYTALNDCVCLELGVCRGAITSYWKPLTNDGDALRLVVKLRLQPFFGDSTVTFVLGEDVINERYGNDPYAATRRAIVRAAAEIGKEMK